MLESGMLNQALANYTRLTVEKRQNQLNLPSFAHNASKQLVEV